MPFRLLDLPALVVEEIAGAVPRAIRRTQAQVELTQRALSHLPCLGDHDRPMDDAPEPAPAAPSSGGLVDGPAPATVRSAPVAAPEPVAAGPDVEVLAIPDYDSLAASQVVPRLASLSGTELADVGAYERAHRSRQTILNRVRQLQADAGDA